LWWTFAAAALLAVLWALGQETVDTEPVPIPERILEVVQWDAADKPIPPEIPASRGGGGVGIPQELGLSPSRRGARPEQPFGDLFSHPVFDADDEGSSRWEAVLADLVFDDAVPELGPGIRSQPGDDGRVDAPLPGGLADLVEQAPRTVVVADVSVRDPSQGRAAVVSPVAPPPPMVSSRALSQAMRGWSRHASACRDRLAPRWHGRVLLRLQVEAGEVTSVEVQGSRAVPPVLATCLQTRARHLLRLDPEETGLGRLPLVFE
jgi:hypothetical protein